MHEAGKGDNPRPYSVDSKTYSDNWDKIFDKKSNNAEDQKEIDKPPGNLPADSDQGG